MASKKARVDKLGSINEKTSQSNTLDDEELMYLLQREKALLLSKLKKTKKDLSEMREVFKNLEFTNLQNPERKEEKFLEFSENVEMWSKQLGMTIEQTNYVKEEHREWHIEGTVDTLKFKLNISCATNESTNKGYIKKFTIKTSTPCQEELERWFGNVDCNIEQIFKVLKAYNEMNKEREIGLEMCKKELGSTIDVHKAEKSGDTIIELGTEDAHYFQIKWKLVPSRRHFAKVKNVCRIACTEQGDKYMKAHIDLPTLRNQLSHRPLELIQLLARGITNNGK